MISKKTGVSLIAPDHLSYEVPSILSKAIGNQRIDPQTALEAVDTFLSYPIQTIRSRSLIRLGLGSVIR